MHFFSERFNAMTTAITLHNCIRFLLLELCQRYNVLIIVPAPMLDINILRKYDYCFYGDSIPTDTCKLELKLSPACARNQGRFSGEGLLDSVNEAL